MAQNPTPSFLDPGQIIKRAYDEANDRIRVDASISISAATQEVVIDHADDSIRLGDGTGLVTATTVGSDIGLDVNVIGGVVSGTFTSSGLSVGIKTTLVTIGTTPTKIPTTPFANRNSMSVRIWNLADTSKIVYFGESSVTIVKGYPKGHGEEFIVDVKDNAAVEIYAIVDVGTAEVRVIELA